jgi:hypothetical protein
MYTWIRKLIVFEGIEVKFTGFILFQDLINSSSRKGWLSEYNNVENHSKAKEITSRCIGSFIGF